MDPWRILFGFLFLSSLALLGVMWVRPELVRPVQAELRGDGGDRETAGHRTRKAASDGEDPGETVKPRLAAPPGPAAVPYVYTVAGAQHDAAIYVPAGAAPQSPRPLLLSFSPTGSALADVRHWQASAERLGWIVATSGHVRNGTSDENDAREYLALLEAVAREHPVDRRAVVLGGFSGGGCGAYSLALRHPERFVGAIVAGGHMGPWRQLSRPPRAPLRFYLFAAEADSNLQPTRALAEAMSGAGYQARLASGPGGHRPLETNEQVEALQWIMGTGR